MKLKSVKIPERSHAQLRRIQYILGVPTLTKALVWLINQEVKK